MGSQDSVSPDFKLSLKAIAGNSFSMDLRHGYAVSSFMDMAYWLSESLIFKISSFKLQNARLLLIFTKYSKITVFRDGAEIINSQVKTMCEKSVTASGLVCQMLSYLERSSLFAKRLVSADYVPAGHVLISADRYRIC
ncbi:hypothetical protein Tco_0810094 [Tanacetum coccineum]